MNNLDSRLKKIEKKLSPREKTVVVLNCCSDDDSDDKTCTVIINNKKYKLPENVKPDQFIKEKTKNLSGMITCVVEISGKSDDLQE